MEEIKEKETRQFRYDNHLGIMKIKVTETRNIKDKDGKIIGNTQSTLRQEITREGFDDIIKNLEKQYTTLNQQRKTLETQIKEFEKDYNEEEIEAEIKRLQKINDYQKYKQTKEQLENLTKSIKKVNKDLNELKDAIKSN